MSEKKDTLRLIEDLLLLAQESAERNSANCTIKEFFHSLKNDFFRLRERARRSTKEYKIAFAGLTNSGKSTLLNALLGYKVAPSSNDTCTASIVEFRYDENFRISAKRPGTNWPEEFPTKSPEALRKKLEELCAHGEGENASPQVDVFLPAEVLKDGLVLVDTPGLGASGEMGAKDEKVLKNFLEKQVAQIFWIACTENGGISRAELKFYERFLKLRCDDLIMTNGDGWNEKARRDFQKRYAPLLEKTLKIRYVDAKRGIGARETKDADALRNAGIPEIEARVRALKEEDGRFQDILESLKRLGNICSKSASEMSFDKDVFVPTLRAQFLAKYRERPELKPWIEMMSR